MSAQDRDEVNGNQAPPPPSGSPYPPAPPSGFGPSAYGSVGPMPGGGEATAAPPVRPASMSTAVKLMQAGAAISLVSGVSTLFMKDQIRDAVTKAAQEKAATSGETVTAANIDALVNVGLITGVLMGLLGALLWLWMAAANGKGRSWARTVSTVFFVLSILSFLASFAQASAMWSQALSLVSLAVGAGAIFMMYKKESSAFYVASRMPRG